MAGAEKIGRQSDYLYSFDMAREAGLSLTTHAGEWGGAESVRQAIFDLDVERIGHGVQVINNANLVRELISRNITLEVCPVSNIALGIFPDMPNHPIARLKDMGVKVCVSTDDPPFFNTNLCREYFELSKAFGWSRKDFQELNITALTAAFCDDTTKANLLKRLETT